MNNFSTIAVFCEKTGSKVAEMAGTDPVACLVTFCLGKRGDSAMNGALRKKVLSELEITNGTVSYNGYYVLYEEGERRIRPFWMD